MGLAARYFRDVIDSFRGGRRFVYALLVDIAYYLFFSVMLLWYLPRFVMPKVGALQAILSQIDAAPSSFPESALPDIKAVSISVITHSLLFILIILVVYTLAKASIWAIVARKRPGALDYIKVFGVNLAIFLLGVLFIYTAPKIFQTNALLVVMLILMPLVVHFVTISHMLIMMRRKLWQALLYPFSKFHHFVLHYMLILLAGFMIISAVMLFKAISINPVLGKIMAVLSVVLAVAGICWAKFLLYQPAKRI
jgi:hypothetical protein